MMISTLLNDMRMSIDMPVDVMAKTLNISQERYDRIESGKATPTLSIIAIVCNLSHRNLKEVIDMISDIELESIVYASVKAAGHIPPSFDLYAEKHLLSKRNLRDGIMELEDEDISFMTKKSIMDQKEIKMWDDKNNDYP